MDHKLYMPDKRNHFFTKEIITRKRAFIGTYWLRFEIFSSLIKSHQVVFFAVSMLKNPSEFQNTA